MIYIIILLVGVVVWYECERTALMSRIEDLETHYETTEYFGEDKSLMYLSREEFNEATDSFS